MNFVGHIHIADHVLDRHAQAGDQPSPTHRDRYLFGSALPDFAAIGRFQLTEAPSDPAMASGVDMHHATDTAFHGSDWFLTHSREVRARLERRGVNRGAARACGHVGVELLLDGHLLEFHGDLRRRAQDVLGLADDDQLDLTELVAGDRQAGWRAHLDRIGSWSLPTDYHRPSAVAERLQRILRPRRRLAFGPDDIAVVASTLAEHLDELVGGIGDMVDAVTAELAASSPNSTR